MPILVLKDKRYQFATRCSDFTNKEAMAVEKATGLSWQEFLDLAGRDVLATTGLVWMCRRRAGDDVAFSDIDFAMGDITFELDEAQRRAIEEAAAEAEAGGNPTRDGTPSGSGPEASPQPKPSTSSRSRKSSASTSGTTTA